MANIKEEEYENLNRELIAVFDRNLAQWIHNFATEVVEDERKWTPIETTISIKHEMDPESGGLVSVQMSAMDGRRVETVILHWPREDT